MPKLRSSGPTVGYLDTRYLRLDGTNSPITGDVTFDDGAGDSPWLIFKNQNDITSSLYFSNDTSPIFYIKNGSTSGVLWIEPSGGAISGNPILKLGKKNNQLLLYSQAPATYSTVGDLYIEASNGGPVTRDNGFDIFISGGSLYGAGKDGNVYLSYDGAVQGKTFIGGTAGSGILNVNGITNITLSPANKVGLFIDQYTNPCTVLGENILTDGLLKAWKKTEKVATGGQNNYHGINVLWNANTETFDIGNQNEQTYGVYYITVDAQSIAGVSTGKLSYTDYCGYYAAGVNAYSNSVYTCGEDTLNQTVSHNVGGIYALGDGNITLDNAYIQFTANVYGIFSKATLSSINLNSYSTAAVNFWGGYFTADGVGSGLTENAVGVYAIAIDVMTNVGVHAVGDTVALKADGPIIPVSSLDDESTLGTSTSEFKDAWVRNYYSNAGILLQAKTDIASGDFCTFSMDTGISLTASSGIQNVLRVTGDINQSGTAGYTGLLIDITRASQGSSDRLAMQFKVDTAEIFAIDQQGTVRFSGTAGIIGAVADASGWMALSGGTAGIFAGNDIMLPCSAGVGFLYGYGGTETHYFGGNMDLTIDWLGTLTSPTTIKGGYLETGTYVGIAADQDLIQLATNILTINGDLKIPSDSKATYFGAGDDMKIYYDGTNGNIDTDLVAASDLYIDCGTAKTVVLEVPVHDDINIGSLILQTGGTLPGIVEILDNTGAGTGVYTRGFAINEQGSACVEIEHTYAEGTNLVAHVHWVGNDAPTGTDYVKWQITYTITREEVTTPAVTTDSAETAYDTQYEWKRTDVETIIGTNIKIGDQINFTIKRIASVGDAYSGEALVGTIGLHFQKDTQGSRTITAK